MTTHNDKVREFHEAFGHPVRTTPNADIPERLARLNWLQEEVNELGVALSAVKEVNLDTNTIVWVHDHEGKFDIVEAADATADIKYFAEGTDLVLGVPSEPVFDAVHDSNMEKLVNGQVLRGPDGKIQKPEGWVPPTERIRAILEAI